MYGDSFFHVSSYVCGNTLKHQNNTEEKTLQQKSDFYNRPLLIGALQCLMKNPNIYN